VSIHGADTEAVEADLLRVRSLLLKVRFRYVVGAYWAWGRGAAVDLVLSIRSALLAAINLMVWQLTVAVCLLGGMALLVKGLVRVAWQSVFGKTNGDRS
jgi:hypothetical protein